MTAKEIEKEQAKREENLFNWGVVEQRKGPFLMVNLEKD